MRYTARYESPLGGILLAADEQGLTGLWFDGSKYNAAGLDPESRPAELPVFDAARRWLDAYFSGREPELLPPLHLIGSDFRLAVWAELQKIPYGHTVTYGEIGRRVAAVLGRKRMSAQAVGGAVGHNPVSILVPCHRVVGTGGSLTGYAGGIGKKQALLQLEGADLSRLFVPAKGTAL